MALIKCTECSGEVSDKAITCPHCGNQITQKVEIKKRSIVKQILLFIFIILVWILGTGIYTHKIDISFLTNSGNKIKKAFSETISGYPNIRDQIPAIDRTNEISLEKVSNLGYTFYLGQIDSSSSINDTLKNDITRIVYTAKFPKSLLEKIPIIFVNNLALKSGQFISFNGSNMKIMDFGPSFLYEGGVYATYESGNAIIYINKEKIASLNDILTHELGHAIGATLTDADWVKYYSLRNIPSSTARGGGLWNLSPFEDFAEVYKNIFTGIDKRTYYGLLLPKYDYEGDTCGSVYAKVYDAKIAEYTPPCSPTDGLCAWGLRTNSVSESQKQQAEDFANANIEVQDCRRDVMINPSKYELDWAMGAPYSSSVGPKTKEFVIEIVDKLNTPVQTNNSIKASRIVPYTVRPGDTLGFLVKKYHTSTSTIKELNNLTSDTLKVGETIKIPLP